MKYQCSLEFHVELRGATKTSLVSLRLINDCLGMSSNFLRSLGPHL
jgi:hypothetical protein